jgi:hypothetical protein
MLLLLLAMERDFFCLRESCWRDGDFPFCAIKKIRAEKFAISSASRLPSLFVRHATHARSFLRESGSLQVADASRELSWMARRCAVFTAASVDYCAKWRTMRRIDNARHEFHPPLEVFNSGKKFRAIKN